MKIYKAWFYEGNGLITKINTIRNTYFFNYGFVSVNEKIEGREYVILLDVHDIRAINGELKKIVDKCCTSLDWSKFGISPYELMKKTIKQ